MFFLDLKESNVRLKLTVVDTVGYGDQINKEDRYVVAGTAEMNGIGMHGNLLIQSQPLTHTNALIALYTFFQI